MIKEMIVILILATFCTANEKFERVDVVLDDKLVERVYFSTFSGKRELISRVYFNDTGKINDSLRYYLDDAKNIESVDVFSYTEIGFIKQNEQDYAKDFGCDLIFSAQSLKYFGYELSDICILLNSVLPDGQDVSEILRTEFDGDLEKLKAENLNVRFLNFSLEIQKHFYDQLLNKAIFHIKGTELLKEEYFFETGKLVKEYTYFDKMLTIEITASYSDGNTHKSVKKYLIRV